jgi:hypothetical protein
MAYFPLITRVAGSNFQFQLSSITGLFIILYYYLLSFIYGIGVFDISPTLSLSQTLSQFSPSLYSYIFSPEYLLFKAI